MYFLEYVEKKNGVEQIKYHLKGKGIPKDQLSLEAFEAMMEGRSIQVQANRDFKRIHVSRNTQQQHCENLSIAKLDALTKTINKRFGKVDVLLTMLQFHSTIILRANYFPMSSTFLF